MTTSVRARIVSYGVDNAAADVHVGNGFVWQRTSEGDIPLLPLADVQLHGRHMLSNVVAATTISHLAGASKQSLAKALAGFHGLEHVMEVVASRGAVRFVNDSKATNVVSARSSFESVSSGLVAILGGRYKGGDFRDLREPLRARARAVVAIGEAAARVEDALADVVPVERAASMDDAVRRAFGRARPGDTVVLAPACSSFDMFGSYAERGHAFKHAVAQLARARHPGCER